VGCRLTPANSFDILRAFQSRLFTWSLKKAPQLRIGAKAGFVLHQFLVLPMLA
jgi:hypothetical protein